MIADLISEAKATKEAIDSAIEGVHEAEMMNEQPQMNAAPPSYEADLFGGFDSPAPAPAAGNTAQHQMASHEPALSTVSSGDEEENASRNVAPGSGGQVETVMSSDDEGAAVPSATTAEPIAMFSNASPAIPHKTL